MNREQAKYHFMAVAPPVPKWFKPDMGEIQNVILGRDYVPDSVMAEMVEAETLLQWPAYYAEEMMKRGEE